MIKVVIFDLDGTLVNSLADLCCSTNFALSKHGFPTHKQEKFNYFVGDGVPKLIERAIPKEQYTKQSAKAVYDEFMNHYREHYLDKTAPYECVESALSQLSSAGIKLAVLSNKVDEMAQKIVKKFFKDTIGCVLGKREDFPLKPNPTSTLSIIEKLGIKPEECAFLGDSGMDMATAVNAGCVAVGVLWGFRTREELLENGAEYLLEKPSDIAPFILGLK